jgi:hypothetical protein
MPQTGEQPPLITDKMPQVKILFYFRTYTALCWHIKLYKVPLASKISFSIAPKATATSSVVRYQTGPTVDKSPGVQGTMATPEERSRKHHHQNPLFQATDRIYTTISQYILQLVTLFSSTTKNPKLQSQNHS